MKRFVLIATMAMFGCTSAAVAAPRTGSISIPGGAPLSGGGPTDDITAASATFAPETGQLEASITLAAAPSAGEDGSIDVYYRSDPSGQCNKGINDAQLFAILDPTNQGAVVSTPVGKGNAQGSKVNSGSTITMKGSSLNLIGIDYQCVFITVANSPTPFDTTSFYFTGFGPPPPPTPTPVESAPPAATPPAKAPTTKQLLAKAITKCKKIKNRHKRSKCIAKAKRHYKKK